MADELPAKKAQESRIKIFGHSCSVRSLIALSVTWTACTLIIWRIEIPDWFAAQFGMVIAFYLGQNTRPSTQTQ